VLDVAGCGRTKVPFPKALRSTVNAGVVETPNQMLYIDHLTGLHVFEFIDARRNLAVRIAGTVASVYSGLTPILAAVGAAGLLLATFFRRSFPFPIALFSADHAHLLENNELLETAMETTLQPFRPV
jgi:hypothetical protein